MLPSVKRLPRGFTVLCALVALLMLSAPARAKYIGGDPPRRCQCESCNSCTTNPACGCETSYTEGNLRETYAGPRIMSSTGPTVAFNASYHTYNADGSRDMRDTVMGYGWTHSYNVFLFTQRGNMYRYDAEGRVTTYKLTSMGRYTAAPGYFETLAKNPDGSFTLTQKDRTRYQFALIPNTPFLVAGPVWRLTRITERNNNQTTLTYDSGGRLTTVTDTYNRSLGFAYSAQNKLTQVTDPLGRLTQFQYDSTGRKLTGITNPLGRSVSYSYNSLYQMTQKVDKDGRLFRFQYRNDKPVTTTDGSGAPLFSLSNPLDWATDGNALARDIERVYTPATTTKTDGRGNPWRYDYDSRGYITTMTAPDNAQTRYTYDVGTATNTLMLASVTDANNHTTSYQYDSQGNLIRKTDPSPFSYVTTYTYEPTFNQMTSMTDANGRVTSYQIDSVNGNRLKETDPLSQTRTWTYDSHGNVLSETDKRGNTTSYTYDAAGNRVQTTDREGHVWRASYDAVGNLVEKVDPQGHVTRYQYDGLNRMTSQTEAFGTAIQAQTRYTYDGQGNRTQVIDPDGNPTSSQYDLRQRLVKTTDALNQTQTQTYDGNDNRTSVTDKNGHATSFQYDLQDRLVQSTDAIPNTMTMSYDPVGNKVSETDANNHTTSYTYDELNRLKTRTDAESFVTRYNYDLIGTPVCAGCSGPTRGSSLVTQQIDGNGKVTYSTYDALDRQILQIRKQTDTAFTIDGDDAVTRYAYDPNDNRVSLTEPNGNTTAYQYDRLDRQTKVTNAASDVTLTSYDDDGNTKTVTAPNLNLTTYSYDALHRVTRIDDSVGLVATYTYDLVGNRLSERDGNGNGSNYTYDAIYRVTDVTDALGKTTHYSYDAVGNLLQTTDRNGKLTTYAYDAINRRVETTDALTNSTQYEYDGVGNLIQITDANNHATHYVYDRINRLVTETYADGGMRSFAYDAVNLVRRTDQKGQVTQYAYSDLYFLLQRDYPGGGHDDTFSYDLSGRMLGACRGGAPDDLADACPGWLVTFTYDGANRVTQTKQDGKTVAYVYNIPGRTRSLTYPGGRSIKETTDPRSRLGQIDDTVSPPIASYSYDLGNRVLTRNYRNGTTATYAYNANNWITSLEHSKGVVRLTGFAHAYDNEGNKAFEQKQPDGGNSQTKSEAYGYDAIYRLIDYKVGTLVGSTVPVPTTQTQYSLDPVGNWDQKVKDGTPENRTHSATNEITQIDAQAIASDANGNTEDDGRYTYAYDEENRLTSVTRKADSRVVGQYQYDALSRRIDKIGDPATPSSPSETRYFYDDARIVEEQSAAGATQATYVYGNYVDEVLNMNRGGSAYFYHQNSLWSVEAITDSSGTVVERYAYDAYGLPTISDGSGVAIPPNGWGTSHSAIGNPWMFTGRQFDEETGIYFYRARYYDPVLGRFLQRDPMQSFLWLNLYLYAGGNPTYFLDPSGEIKVDFTQWTKWDCEKTCAWYECTAKQYGKLKRESKGQWQFKVSSIDGDKLTLTATGSGPAPGGTNVSGSFESKSERNDSSIGNKICFDIIKITSEEACGCVCGFLWLSCCYPEDSDFQCVKYRFEPSQCKNEGKTK